MKRYFRWSLFLPFAIALLGVALSSIWPGAPFIGGLILLGCVPYLPIAAALWVLIGRCKNKRQLVLLSVVAPLVYAVVAFVFFSVVNGAPQFLVHSFPGFAVIILLYSYPVVALAWVGFLVLQFVKRAPIAP